MLRIQQNNISLYKYCNCFTTATTSAPTTTTTTPTTTCETDVEYQGCGTGSIAKGGAITGVVSCQNHCKNAYGASRFTLRTNSPQLECRCQICKGTKRIKTGFVSGKITCAGKIAIVYLQFLVLDLLFDNS